MYFGEVAIFTDCLSNCLSYLATVTQLGSLSCVLEKEIHYDSPSLTQRWKWVWPSCPNCCKNAWFQLENNYSYPPQEEQWEIPKRREGCQKPQIIKESKNQAEGHVQKTLPGRGTWGYFLEQHNNKMLWMTWKRNLWEEGKEGVVMVMGTERKKNVNVFQQNKGTKRCYLLKKGLEPLLYVVIIIIIIIIKW